MSIALLLALFATTADAQSCHEPYDEATLVSDLKGVDAALSSFDLQLARDRLVDAHRGLLCIETIAKPSHLAKMSQQLSMVFFFDQDEAATTRWGLSARLAWPEAPWPSDMDEEHPLRESLSMHDMPSAVGPADDGQGLVFPKRGAAFMHGRPFYEPRAPIEVPVFIQLTDSKGVIVRQYWQDGSAFPEELIGPDTSPSKEPPKWFVPEAPEARITQKSPLWAESDTLAVAAGPSAMESWDYGADDDGGDAVAVVEPAAPVAKPPAPVAKPPAPVAKPSAVEPDAADVVVATAVSVEAYVDPFTEAKMRAIVKERSVRTEVDASGASRTITTEIVTFVEDKANVPPVSAEDFSAWIAYRPDWQRDVAIAEGRADKGYLQGWADGVPPGPPKAPVAEVSWQAAKAYCDDWSSGLASAEVASPPPTIDEWRQADGAPAIRTAKGKAKAYDGDTSTTSSAIGFRCVD